MFAVVDPVRLTLVGQSHIVEDETKVYVPITKDLYMRLMDFPETFLFYKAAKGEDGVYRLVEHTPVTRNGSLMTPLLEGSEPANFVLRLSDLQLEFNTDTEFTLDLMVTDSCSFGHVLFHHEFKPGEIIEHKLKTLERLSFWIVQPYEKHSYVLVRS